MLQEFSVLISVFYPDLELHFIVMCFRVEGNKLRKGTGKVWVFFLKV